MRNYLKRVVTFVAFAMLAFVSASAAEPTAVEIKVKEIVKKYDSEKGVSCWNFVKGRGLELIKMALNKEVGKEFMKGVTRITIIDYSDASEQTCQALRKEFEVFKTMLEEFKSKSEKESAEKDNSIAYAAISDDQSISDFIFSSESADSKMIMYMAGKIEVTDLIK
jgi:hypothetical protein